MNRRFLVGALAVAILLPGCYEILSWSPDGRYLAFVKPEQGLWLWDTETREPKQLLDSARVLNCSYLPSGRSILVDLKKDEDDNEETDVYRLTIKSGKLELLVPRCAQYLYDVSPDGRYFHYLVRAGESGGSELWKLDLRHPKRRELLLHTFLEPYMLRVDPSGKQLLFYADVGSREAICLFEPDNRNTREAFSKALETRILVDADNEAWPTWIDEDRFAYVKPYDGGNGNGLFVHSLSTGASRNLLDHVKPPGATLSPDAKRLAATVSGLTGETGSNPNGLSDIQIAVVDVATGKWRVVTDEPMGAACGTFSPKGNQIAYLTPPDLDQPGLVRILDLDTGERTTVWHNEPERLLGRAETARDNGDAPAALGLYHAFLEAYPDSDFAPLAAYRIVSLCTDDAPALVDQAFTAFKRLQGDLRRQARMLLWRKAALIATDPAKDSMIACAIPEAQEKVSYNTDETRDLLSLSAKWGVDRLYLRLDYAVGRDLTGTDFKDTVLLFDLDSPDAGYRAITPNTQWDRGAERVVILSQWKESGATSRYDIKILNEEGKTLSHYDAAGFDDAVYPHVDVLDRDGSRPGMLVLSLSRKILELSDDKAVHLQVCTLKGGRDKQRNECPRDAVNEADPKCDVADAFGAANTRERLDKDLKAGRPPAILGYVTLREKGDDGATKSREREVSIPRQSRGFML